MTEPGSDTFADLPTDAETEVEITQRLRLSASLSFRHRADRWAAMSDEDRARSIRQAIGLIQRDLDRHGFEAGTVTFHACNIEPDGPFGEESV